MSGAGIGANLNDYLQLTFWFEAGSDLNARTNSLGQQSGTFDIANVQLERGTIATDFEKQSISEVLTQCQRYYTKTFSQGVTPAQNLTKEGAISSIATSTGHFSLEWVYPVTMRDAPTLVKYNPSAANISARNQTNGTDTGLTLAPESNDRVAYFTEDSVDGTDANDFMSIQVTADAEF